ncbi:hypothetical protein [Rhodoplanes sp. SY1]|uniref:ADP-ribosyltransferase-containing protein n=1 Tax=Rhodoplanes sp. SY1 TaxID=3166646 RepID=UPI0038B4EEAF
MDWYRVIKTIRGRRYVYLQKTWRAGACVRCHSRYMGPASLRAIGYHGTFAKFEWFDRAECGSNTKANDACEGFFFASNRRVAISYASAEVAAERGLDATIAKIEHRVTEAFGVDWREVEMTLDGNGYDSDPEMKSLARNYLGRLKRAQTRFRDLRERGIFRELRPSKRGDVKERRLVIERPYYYDMGCRRYDPYSYEDAIEAAKESGHDGVVIKNTYDGYSFAMMTNPTAADLTDVYIVFDERQIVEAA